MKDIEKAIKHFECVKRDAVAVLDSGFGTKPNESNTVYKNRKLYAELAINALKKQIPKKPRHRKKMYSMSGYYTCRCCGNWVLVTQHFCCRCGQALDWSDTDDKQ